MSKNHDLEKGGAYQIRKHRRDATKIRRTPSEAAVAGSESKLVSIKKLHLFKRMRIFQPYSAVVAAFKDSKFLEVSGEEGKMVKHKVPYKSVLRPRPRLLLSTLMDLVTSSRYIVQPQGLFAHFGESMVCSFVVPTNASSKAPSWGPLPKPKKSPLTRWHFSESS
ncbi:hypothetical protein ACSS6W_005033 [Trichoderma asperelloides]